MDPPRLNVVDPSAPSKNFPPPNYVGASLFPYPLDPFQTHAVSAICRGENVLVTAKTGSGKTAVGLYAIAHALANGMRVFYSTPIKALSNQKYAELKKVFPEASVGIMTGASICPNHILNASRAPKPSIQTTPPFNANR